MRRPSLNKLLSFEAAGRTLSFRAAADLLHVTQGAVAQQVRALEAELGVPLFERHSRGLTLTDAGSRYLDAVGRGLHVIDEATRALHNPVPRITISLPPSLAAKWLVPRLPDFQSRHPDLEIATVASERLADFRNDGIDLAIRIGTPPFPGLENQFLSDMELRAVCAPQYLDAMGPIHGLADLKGHRLLQDGHVSWQSFLSDSGLLPSCTLIDFNHSSLTIEAAVDGQGIALVPTVIAGHDLSLGRLQTIESLEPARSTGRAYHLVYPKNAPANDTARQSVIGWVLDQFQDQS